MRYDPGAGGVLLITQWLGVAVGEGGKGSVAKRDVTLCMGLEPAAMPESGKIPAAQLNTADNTTPPTLLWEAAALGAEKRGLLEYLWLNF